MNAIAREVSFRRIEVQPARHWIARVRAWLRTEYAASEPAFFHGVEEVVADAARRRAAVLRGIGQK
jgi:hypothetical protein